jgi:putative ABC transport system permease protein
VPWELGPVIRGLKRRTGTFALVLLEVASGFTTLTALILASTWYGQFNAIPSGFDHRPLIAVSLQNPAPDPDPTRALQATRVLHQQILHQLRAVPQVVAAAPVSSTVLDARSNYPVRFQAASGAPPASTSGWTIYSSPALATVLPLRIREGRFPAETADGGLADLVVLTRCLRERLFPGGAPAIGRLVEADDARPAQVAAVVDDVVLGDPWNMRSNCLALRFRWPGTERDARFLVRAAAGKQPEVLAGVRAALGASSPQRRVVIEPYDPAQAHRAKMARGLVLTLAVFGIIVALIALVGTFTVSSFLVRERVRTIGIRRALGGTPRQIVRFFLVENTVVVLGGIGLGVLMSIGLFLVMRRLYPGLHLSWRPLLFTGVVLWIDATIAAWLPARRAAGIAPATPGRGLR